MEKGTFRQHRTFILRSRFSINLPIIPNWPMSSSNSYLPGDFHIALHGAPPSKTSGNNIWSCFNTNIFSFRTSLKADVHRWFEPIGFIWCETCFIRSGQDHSQTHQLRWSCTAVMEGWAHSGPLSWWQWPWTGSWQRERAAGWRSLGVPGKRTGSAIGLAPSGPPQTGPENLWTKAGSMLCMFRVLVLLCLYFTDAVINVLPNPIIYVTNASLILEFELKIRNSNTNIPPGGGIVLCWN